MKISAVFAFQRRYSRYIYFQSKGLYSVTAFKYASGSPFKIRSAYHIPKSGDAVTVYLGGNKIEDTSFLDAISQIYSSDEDTVEVASADIHLKTDTQDMRSVHVAFNDCPIAVFMGFLGKIDGEWIVITDSLNQLEVNDNGGIGIPHKTECQKINPKHIPILEQYFN